jgi:glycosyltransferase involved in cell wall biosynthesis
VSAAPLLFVTGHVPAYRVGAFAELHEREGIELALFGGRSQHGGAEAEGELPFPSTRASPAAIAALAARGGHRAVIASTGGRLALPAAWAGARAGRRPLLLWASLWAHPRSAAHAIGYLPMRRLYRSADAVITYGPHVSAYVRRHGARNVHEAPQAVDNAFWTATATPRPGAGVRFLFAGRDAPEKGLGVLLEAWRQAALEGASLGLAGAGLDRAGAGTDGVRALGPLAPAGLRDAYAASDVLVVPSIATPTFREPWGLVVNEAMNAGLAVIASDAVGAAAGGLVRDGETGLVVPAGDSGALAGAITRLAHDAALRERLGAAARLGVSAYTYAAWAQGFSKALSTLGLARAQSSLPRRV